MDIDQPFIRLPFSFDAKKLAEEVAGIPGNAWMAHPSRMNGNSAVALISRNGEDNDDFDGRMLESKHLENCAYLRQVLASFGEVLGRSRLMKLAGKAEVSTHVDFNYHWYTRVRIHIPVITNAGVIFHCADQQRQMRAGECWIFNSWRRHKVVNASDEDRIHLVIDTAGSSRFWAMVDRCRAKEPTDDETTHIAFQEDREVNILTEKYNTAPVMAPGEMDALVAELLRDFEQFGKNDPRLVAKYKSLLTGMAKDWREVWHIYGYEKEGWPHYRRIIDAVFKQLESDPRALITESNQIGVNPIIVQRILRSALAIENLPRFVDGVDL